MTNIIEDAIFTHIAGVTYDNKQHLARNLKTGDVLDLVREPHNEYDSCAIAVYSHGQHLGYVPREDNWRIYHRMDRGDIFKCTVGDLRHTVGKRIITSGVMIKIECTEIKNKYEEYFRNLNEEISIAVERYFAENPVEHEAIPWEDFLETIERENSYLELYENGKVLATLKRKGKHIELTQNDEIEKKTEMMMLSFITKLAKLNRVLNPVLDHAISDSYESEIDFPNVMMILKMVDNREDASFIYEYLKEKAVRM